MQISCTTCIIRDAFLLGLMTMGAYILRTGWSSRKYCLSRLGTHCVEPVPVVPYPVLGASGVVLVLGSVYAPNMQVMDRKF